MREPVRGDPVWTVEEDPDDNAWWPHITQVLGEQDGLFEVLLENDGISTWIQWNDHNWEEA